MGLTQKLKAMLATTNDDGLAEFRSIIARQDAYEREGAMAGLAGKTLDDCPYDRETQNEAWNFWVYGCDDAREERLTLERGTLTFSDIGPGPNYTVLRTWTETAEEAYRNKHWRPRWAPVPSEWTSAPA